MVSSDEKDQTGGRVVISRLGELVAIKERQERRKITNKEIAETTGLMPNTVGRWMLPEPFNQINVDVAQRLARYVGVEFGDLFEEVEAEPQ